MHDRSTWQGNLLPIDTSVVVSVRNRSLGLRGWNSKRSPLHHFVDQAIAQYPVENEKFQLPPRTRTTFITAFSRDNSVLASCHGDHNTHILDVKTKKVLKSLSGHERSPWCVTFHPGTSEIIATGSLNGEVRVWDLRGDGSESWTLESPDDEQVAIASLSFHPYDHVLAIAGGNEIYFWDWSLPQPFASVKTNLRDEKVRLVRFDPWGHSIITGVGNADEDNEEDDSAFDQLSWFIPALQRPSWRSGTSELRPSARLRSRHRNSGRDYPMGASPTETRRREIIRERRRRMIRPGQWPDEVEFADVNTPSTRSDGPQSSRLRRDISETHQRILHARVSVNEEIRQQYTRLQMLRQERHRLEMRLRELQNSANEVRNSTPSIRGYLSHRELDRSTEHADPTVLVEPARAPYPTGTHSVIVGQSWSRTDSMNDNEASSQPPSSHQSSSLVVEPMESSSRDPLASGYSEPRIAPYVFFPNFEIYNQQNNSGTQRPEESLLLGNRNPSSSRSGYETFSLNESNNLLNERDPVIQTANPPSDPTNGLLSLAISAEQVESTNSVNQSAGDDPVEVRIPGVETSVVVGSSSTTNEGLIDFHRFSRRDFSEDFRRASPSNITRNIPVITSRLNNLQSSNLSRWRPEANPFARTSNHSESTNQNPRHLREPEDGPALSSNPRPGMMSVRVQMGDMDRNNGRFAFYPADGVQEPSSDTITPTRTPSLYPNFSNSSAMTPSLTSRLDSSQMEGTATGGDAMDRQTSFFISPYRDPPSGSANTNATSDTSRRRIPSEISSDEPVRSSNTFSVASQFETSHFESNQSGSNSQRSFPPPPSYSEAMTQSTPVDLSTFSSSTQNPHQPTSSVVQPDSSERQTAGDQTEFSMLHGRNENNPTDENPSLVAAQSLSAAVNSLIEATDSLNEAADSLLREAANSASNLMEQDDSDSSGTTSPTVVEPLADHWPQAINNSLPATSVPLPTDSAPARIAEPRGPTVEPSISSGTSRSSTLPPTSHSRSPAVEFGSDGRLRPVRPWRPRSNNNDTTPAPITITFSRRRLPLPSDSDSGSEGERRYRPTRRHQQEGHVPPSHRTSSRGWNDGPSLAVNFRPNTRSLGTSRQHSSRSRQSRRITSLRRSNINRIISDVYAENYGHRAVILNLDNSTYRLQYWDFSKLELPEISRHDVNVLVPHCKIYNDASVDISRDGRLLAAFVPSYGDCPNNMMDVGVFSLESKNLGQLLFRRAYEPIAVCLSISPLCNQICVGLKNRPFLLGESRPASFLMGHVLELSSDDSSQMPVVCHINHPAQDGTSRIVSINTISWSPKVGGGLVYGTTSGDLRMCTLKPKDAKVDATEDDSAMVAESSQSSG